MINITTSLRKRLGLCDLPTDIDRPLKLKPGTAQVLLADDMYEGVPTEDLISYAQQRLKSTPADRATAIAILRGAF